MTAILLLVATPAGASPMNAWKSSVRPSLVAWRSTYLKIDAALHVNEIATARTLLVTFSVDSVDLAQHADSPDSKLNAALMNVARASSTWAFYAALALGGSVTYAEMFTAYTPHLKAALVTLEGMPS